MRTLLPSSVRQSALKIVPVVAVVLSFAASTLAGPKKIVKVSATGQIVSSEFCPYPQLCQEVHVTGTATALGRVSGVLSEVVDVETGRYTGSGVFTMADGSTITTEFVGQVTPPDQDGRSFFMERHQFVDGSGQYENASGDLELSGSGDATGALVVSGTGTLIRG
jgi:hypothetical protein